MLRIENNLPSDATLRSQLNDDELPSNDWGLDRLGEFAQRLNITMVTNEKMLAADYWRLGSALVKARRQLCRGHWLPFLKSLGIEKTRSSKACAIFRTFSAVAEVQELTVEQAYQARRQLPSSRSAADDEELIEADDATHDVFQQFDEQALQLRAEIKSAGHGELQGLLGRVRMWIDRLSDLELSLKQALDELEQI